MALEDLDEVTLIEKTQPRRQFDGVFSLSEFLFRVVDAQHRLVGVRREHEALLEEARDVELVDPGDLLEPVQSDLLEKRRLDRI